jgi:hypothetical protein
MMKKGCYVFLALIIAVMAMGCASSSPTVGTDPSDLPDFVLNPPSQEDAIFGMGSAKLSSDNQSMSIAEARARQSLAFQLNANVQAMITDYSREAGTQNNTASLEFVESVGRQVTQAQLNGVVPVKREKLKDGTWWVLVSYSKADAAKAAAGIIENEASRYAEFKAMDALQRMDDQLSKINTTPEPVTK